MDFKIVTRAHCLQVFAICYLFTVIHGQIPLKFFVEGKKFTESGIRHYTVWEDKPRHLICSTQLPVTHEIIIAADNEHPKNDKHTNKVLLKYRANEIEVNYTCQLKFLSNAPDGHTLLYVLDSFMTIKALEEKPVCSTSVGKSGYIGEDVTIICNGEGETRWSSLNGNEREESLEVSLNKGITPTYECQNNINESGWQTVCNLTHMTILSVLEVEITPSSYSADSQVLEFTCTSSPPRLMYWRLFGSNGDILDLDHYGAFLKADTNISIAQKPGETTLHISEAFPAANGIYAVVCFTYETQSKAAVARLLQSNENVGFVVSTASLLVVIVVIVVIFILMHFLGKKIATSNSDAKKSVSPTTTDLLTNSSYQPYGEQNVNTLNKMEEEYAYLE